MEVIESIVTDSIEVENSTSTISTSKTEFVWTLQATWHLVRVRLDMEPEFDQPVCKKKRLWENVAERVTARLRAEGYTDVPARAFECDLKWRNMLATYRKNAERVKRLGVHGVHWEFFRAMHEVLGRSYEEIEAQRKAKLSNTKLGKAMAKFVWTLQATWHLVRVRLDMEPEFDQPVCKKKRLWENVAERVTARLRAEGYTDVPARAFECDLKWRNMLATYRKNAERVKRLGAHGVHWEFFRAMHEVLGRSYEEIEAQRKAKLSNTKLGKAMAKTRVTSHDSDQTSRIL
ncbi:hypothetical protein PGIGA_G00042040 [Pangasianodon gigas]|uniref:Uncharacterized protein n=1 Tax=Pangasianodon gigas TaxID=30993 RepID=A0ACC5X125_PANGG|nr:hypothetical protein [Pangasianodon gigas]